VAPRFAWPRAKYLLFGFIGLMVAYVLNHNERFLIDAKHPEWLHIRTFKWWLLPHGLMGACALLLGPMQFSDRLRQRFTKFHRVAAATDAILWMLTTGIAFAFILKGKVQQHRQWMTRSFAVAIVFLEVRVVLGVTGLEKVAGGVFDETVVWACVAFSLLFADIALQWQELRRTRPAPARAQTAAGAASPSAALAGD
jgi:uncharacterized membrane protein